MRARVIGCHVTHFSWSWRSAPRSARHDDTGTVRPRRAACRAGPDCTIEGPRFGQFVSLRPTEPDRQIVRQTRLRVSDLNLRRKRLAQRSCSGQQRHSEITACTTARLHQASLLDAYRFFSACLLSGAQLGKRTLTLGSCFRSCCRVARRTLTSGRSQIRT
jgi:hypothetical protein